MSDLRELYQEMILDHYKKPHNFGKPDSADGDATGNNPLCGDVVNVYVSINDDIVTDVSFDGEGCAISTAAASMMTDAIKGKPVDEAREIAKQFHQMVTEAKAGEDLGKLEVFSGVRDHPSRIKCATLCWHTLCAALEGSTEEVTTE